MVALFDRTSSAKPKDCTSDRSPGHCGLHHRIALWPQRCRVRLFGGDDPVAHSTYCVVLARNVDFSMGSASSSRPAVARRHCGRCPCPRSSILFRSIGSAFLETFTWGRHYCWHIFLGALVSYGTEDVLP